MLKTLNKREQELLEGLLTADRTLIQEMYDAYQAGVISFIKQRGGTESDAKDVFQDAILVLYKKVKANDLVLTVSLNSFIKAICRNMWLTKIRDKRELNVEVNEDENMLLEEQIEDVLTGVLREKIYRKHFLNLGEQCQHILKLFFSKVKMKEIAVKLNITEKYVKKRKFECKEKLIVAIKNDPHFKELKF
ncbi:MAG: hypothetical protein CMO01_04950 [Thalassobius sp.]|nr:hypothetical protein [Thalassovita sp.]